MKTVGQKEFVPTEEQRQAIEHVHGPMLVVAGAGTGKTTVLTRRIAHLIETGTAKPHQILAVTYTRNAARQLMQRVSELLYPGDPLALGKIKSSGLQASTFHAYCFGLLREAGIEFELIDDKDLFVLLRPRLEDLKLEYFTKAANPGKFLLDLTDFFRRCHDELRTPDDYDAYVSRLERKEIPVSRVAKSKDAGEMTEAEVLGRSGEIARVFRYTEGFLQRERLGTFGHILTRAVGLLESEPSLLQRARKRARFVLIDEFQDSNVAQIRLAKLLGGETANVFAVGDPDQAVYRFRGATSGTFDQFLKTFGAERVARVTMAKNRRSTPPILRCAFEAISDNPQITSVVLPDGPWKRQPLTCGRLEQEPGLTNAVPVQVVVHNRHEQEAGFIAGTIDKLRKQQPGLKLSSFAVLYRGHGSREPMVAELRRRKVPFEVKGVDLFETPEVRDALAALRAIDSTDPIALFRIAALPHFGVDPMRFRAELAVAGENQSVESTLERVPGGFAVMEAIRETRRDLENANGSLTEAVKALRGRLGLGDSAPDRRLQKFAEAWLKKPKAIVGTGTLREFLKYLDLFREAGGALSVSGGDEDALGDLWPEEAKDSPARDAVQLMTVHAAKGLEFPCVFVLRVASQSFPVNYRETLVEFPAQLRDKDTEGEGDPKNLHAEEERRLFYVSTTRAMDQLYLCGKRQDRGKDPVPSRYLRDLKDRMKTELLGAVELTFLPSGETVSYLAAAAEPAPPLNLARWVELPARADARTKNLSASAIQEYEHCPLAYKLDRDWHIPAEPVASKQFGSAMHLALKAYFDGVAAGRPPDEGTVIQCFLDEFAKAKIGEALQRQMYEKDGREQLARLLRSELAKPMGTALRSEQSFQIDVGGAVVKGRMDRIDMLDGNAVAIIDYKTGNPQSQKEANDSLQLSIYALAARRMGMESAKLVLVNLQNTTAIMTERSAEALVETETKIVEVAEKIARGEFDPKPNFFCDRCPYFTICPAQEVVIESSTNPDDK